MKNAVIFFVSVAANHLSLGLSSGLLVAVPIPEEFAMDAQDMETAIANAINEAKLVWTIAISLFIRYKITIYGVYLL